MLTCTAVIAQLGELKTEDLKVSGSIPDCGTTFDLPRGQSVKNLSPTSELSLSPLKFFLNSYIPWNRVCDTAEKYVVRIILIV